MVNAFSLAWEPTKEEAYLPTHRKVSLRINIWAFFSPHLVVRVQQLSSSITIAAGYWALLNR